MKPWAIFEIVRKRLNKNNDKHIKAITIIDRLPFNARFPTHAKPGYYIVPGRYTPDSSEDLGLVGSIEFTIYVHRDDKDIEGTTSLLKYNTDITKILEAIFNVTDGANKEITTGDIKFRGCNQHMDFTEDNENPRPFYLLEAVFEVDCSFEGDYT